MAYSFQEIMNIKDEGQVVVLLLITIPLCITATVLRLVATRRAGHKLRWDDFFAVLALISFLVYAILSMVGLFLAGDFYNDDEDQLVLVAKISYIASPFFYLNQLFARGCLFILYHRIFWSDRVFLRWIYALGAIHVSWFIAFFFAVLFLCTPVSKWWDIEGTEPGTCIDPNTFFVAEETINSSIDIAMIILTVYVIRKVMSKEYIKYKLTFIFVLGGLSGVIGFVKIGVVYGVDNDQGMENTTSGFWDLLQMATSIICICAQMYKVFIPLQGVWARLKSSLTSWTGGSRHNKSGRRSGKSTKKSSHGDGNGATGEPKAPQYIGAAEVEYTWSQFDRADIPIPTLNPNDKKAERHGDTAEMV